MATDRLEPPTATADPITPETVRETRQAFIEYLEREGIEQSAFEALFTPRARFLCLRELVGATEPLTSREIVERAGVDYSTWSEQHRDVLLASGVVESRGHKGNAEVFGVNHAHPVTQLLRMLEAVVRQGETPLLLDDQFIGAPEDGYEPGAHPADDRDD